jgi:hypothetical protein
MSLSLLFTNYNWSSNNACFLDSDRRGTFTPRA